MATSQRLPSDGQQWIARLRAGDEAAFEALFRALAPGLCALVTRYVGSRAVAEELVQELFFDLWQRRDQLQPEQAITSYLSVAARHRALNWLRHERRITPWSAAAAQRHDAECDPSSPDATELLDTLELQDAVAQLPARCRLIFTLSRQHDMSYSDIAGSLGLSIKTVETQMGRALKSLRERLRHLL